MRLDVIISIILGIAATLLLKAVVWRDLPMSRNAVTLSFGLSSGVALCALRWLRSRKPGHTREKEELE